MKKFKLSLATIAIAGTVLVTSCVGSFSMFNKLAKWNNNATGNKFLNELIFIVISPAYAIAGLADVLILNTIEFWSGDNPMAMQNGKTYKVKGEDGKLYAVKQTQNGYEITKPNGDKYSFVHNKENNSWGISQNGKTTEIFRFNENGTIKATLNNGQTTDLTLDEAGIMKAKMYSACSFYAMK